MSSPEIVLAAIAGRTTRIRLGTAVTVLSSDDPVRVFERFATLDAASSGRAEIILGRGSFTESFPLFGYDLQQYEELFEEKLELFSLLLAENAVTWKGNTRAPLNAQEVYPKTESGRLKTWIGVGGSQESVVRAAKYGLPMMLAIIGGDPGRFLPFVELYQRATEHFKTPTLPIGIHSPGHIADTDDRPRMSCGRTTRRCATGSAPSAAGVRPGARSSTARWLRDRFMLGRRRPWPRRSRPRFGCWGLAGLI